MLYVSHINADNTISVKDSDSKVITHIDRRQIEEGNNIPFVLGVFRYNNSVEIHEITWENGSDCLIPLIQTISNPHIKQYAELVRHIIPPYIFEIPASSTGKYHPASDAGLGGLKRHLISVTKMLMYLVQPEFSKQLFTSDEIDIMKVACMMHDGLKNGWEQSKYTKHEHPMLMAKAIMGCQTILPAQLIQKIAECIASHMGEWNEDKYGNGATLPKPSNKCQYYVHLADFLASRSDVNFVFGDTVYYLEGQTPEKTGPTAKVELKDSDIQAVDKAMVKIKSKRVSPAMKKKLGIERSQAEIVSIWESIQKYKNCSEKQMKYLELAKNFIKN